MTPVNKILYNLENNPDYAVEKEDVYELCEREKHRQQLIGYCEQYLYDYPEMER